MASSSWAFDLCHSLIALLMSCSACRLLPYCSKFCSWTVIGRSSKIPLRKSKEPIDGSGSGMDSSVVYFLSARLNDIQRQVRRGDLLCVWFTGVTRIPDPIPRSRNSRELVIGVHDLDGRLGTRKCMICLVYRGCLICLVYRVCMICLVYRGCMICLVRIDKMIFDDEVEESSCYCEDDFNV